MDMDAEEAFEEMIRQEKAKDKDAGNNGPAAPPQTPGAGTSGSQTPTPGGSTSTPGSSQPQTPGVSTLTS